MAKLTVPIIVKWDDIEEDLAKGNIVKVVRCKDCKYWSEKYKWCGFNDTDVELDDFCSWAEREEK